MTTLDMSFFSNNELPQELNYYISSSQYIQFAAIPFVRTSYVVINVNFNNISITSVALYINFYTFHSVAVR